MINGKKYDWEDITVTMPHGVAAAITDIKYKDGQSVVARYGRGSIASGFGTGNYEASVSFTLDRDEWELLAPYLTQNGGGIYDHKPFPIVCTYANDDQPEIVDTLPEIKITSMDGGGGSQGDDNASPITCEAVCLKPILWNGRPAKRAGRAVPA